MSLLRIEDHSIIMKTTLLSFVFHLAVINFFVFVFSSKDKKPIPNFIFLGSILEKQDISESMKPQDKQASPMTQVATDVLLRSHVEQFSSISLTKPSTPYEWRKPIKLTVKTNFLEPALKTDSQNTANDLGIDLDTTPYQPLRLRP